MRINFYAGCRLDRVARLRHDPDWVAARLADPRTRLVPVWRSHNLVLAGPAPRAALLDLGRARDLLAVSQEVVLLGFAESVAHFAVDLAVEEPARDPALSAAGQFVDLRQVGPLLSREEGSLLAYARGLVHWHGRHRYCGVCGSATVSADAGHIRRCTNPDCRADHFPRTDPAVIMLVSDGERVVLGRQPQWPPGMHSVLAGFVEPGESLEEAVRREVMEEIGIEIEEVRYHSSQPWPFPASIMLGFTARAVSTALSVSKDELEDARWYTRAELIASPEDERFRLPRRDSIARRLIADWLAEGP
jgi:NAD+ diphosphatase